MEFAAVLMKPPKIPSGGKGTEDNTSPAHPLNQHMGEAEDSESNDFGGG